MNDQQPVLPPAPWYSSEVQVRAVIALGAQLISILFRALGRYTDFDITTEMVDALVADLTQATAIIFGALAVMKRGNSAVAPLTLTAGAAAVRTVQNPPLLDADPTKIPLPPKET